ncbi:DUF6338 family protein [Actinomadura sp. B10D3]|uniref:DUF6338 family protein n=1 Tax=Actinomadura sp. B10D3 TaxID=3153557 RepID=UPI00325F5EC7
MPSNALALAVLIVALAPGFAYHRVYRRRVPAEKRTATEEIVELFCAGALGSFAASLVVLGLAQAVSGLVTLDILLGVGKELRAHAWAAVLSGALALALSALFCAAAGVAMGRLSRSGVGQIRPGTLFARTVTARSRTGRRPYLAVELVDGRLVEGYLRYVAIDEDPARRDMVLQRPIAWSGTGYAERTLSRAARVLLRGSMIGAIHVSFPEPRRVAPPDRTAGDGSRTDGDETQTAEDGARSASQTAPTGS